MFFGLRGRGGAGTDQAAPQATDATAAPVSPSGSPAASAGADTIAAPGPADAPGRVLFGEMTWFPSAGYLVVVPDELDEWFAEPLTLPTRRAMSA